MDLQNNTPSEGQPKPLSGPEIYQRMRERALNVRSRQLGLSPEPYEPYGVVMELGILKGGTATFIAMAEGSVSAYFSNGGGRIGCGGVESVRAAGLEFVSAARDYVSMMEPAHSYPLPGPGRARFYVLTSEGVFTFEDDHEDLGYNRSPISPLFHAGDRMITEIRRTS